VFPGANFSQFPPYASREQGPWLWKIVLDFESADTVINLSSGVPVLLLFLEAWRTTFRIFNPQSHLNTFIKEAKRPYSIRL
jgi:hypothetical protein